MTDERERELHRRREEEEDGQPGSAEGERAEEASERVPDEASGEGGTPLGATDQHSDAPGPHGTG